MKPHHKIFILFVSSCLSLTIATPLTAQTNAVDHHHHDAHASSGLNLDQGKKWQTDTPLRQGMQSINDAVRKAIPAFHHDELNSADAKQLANHINSQVNYLIANCKLEPKADATLHVLIGDLLSGADKLSKDPLSNQGMPTLVKTLLQYPDYFDHQGWKDVTED